MPPPVTCVVFVETRNTSCARWRSRISATPLFLTSFRASAVARRCVTNLVVCVPNTLDEFPPISAIGTELGVTAQFVECEMRGEAHGMREAMRLVDDDAVVMVLTYPGPIDWSALERALDEFERCPELKVVSFRSKFDAQCNRGLENMYGHVSIVRTVTESAMYQQMVGLPGDMWTDVILAMCERLVVTQKEHIKLDWTSDEGIFLADKGDAVVFVEDGKDAPGASPGALLVHKGEVQSIDSKEGTARISFMKDEEPCVINVPFSAFRVVRRYAPIQHLESRMKTCSLIRHRYTGAPSEDELFGGLQSMAEALQKALVISLLTQFTADATQQARDFFSKQGHTDKEIVESIVALARLDGVRQVALLAGHENESGISIEEALSFPWEGRGPLPLMARCFPPSCEIEPLTMDRILLNTHPWFRGNGRRAADSFVRAYCAKAYAYVSDL